MTKITYNGRTFPVKGEDKCSYLCVYVCICMSVRVNYRIRFEVVEISNERKILVSTGLYSSIFLLRWSHSKRNEVLQELPSDLSSITKLGRKCIYHEKLDFVYSFKPPDVSIGNVPSGLRRHSKVWLNLGMNQYQSRGTGIEPVIDMGRSSVEPFTLVNPHTGQHLPLRQLHSLFLSYLQTFL